MDWEEIKNKALEELLGIFDLPSLYDWKVKYLGRNGVLNEKIKDIAQLPLEERKKIGEIFNSVKKVLTEEFNKREKFLKEKSSEKKELLDVTKPGKKLPRGAIHPLAKAEKEIRDIFRSLNFAVVYGPELENEYYNFDALNVPANHPARDMWDTFWLDSKKHLLLRTHTSPMQIRYMEKHDPPLRIIVPGRVFRYEAIDASHSINFYQVEGLMVDENVSLAHFKFIVETFFKKFFGKKIDFRYRPSYFPFTEPSLEVDIKIGNKWLEVMGAGMVSRYVFEAVKYDPRKISGFAFGMGLDRLTMIKYKVNDIRMFYENDLRFLKQF